MGGTLGKFAIIFMVIAAVMAIVQRIAPAAPNQRRTLRNTLTDLGFLALNRLLTRPATRLAVLLVAAAWAALVAGSFSPEAMLTAFSSRSPLAAQPLWLQSLEIVLLGDFIGYWLHRGFHQGTLWRYHAVHHSSEAMDWLSAPRVHPINQLLGTMLRVVPMFILGFEVEAMAFTIPGLALYGLLIHANVWWRFGLLRYVITTPAFHRWHHAAPSALPSTLRASSVNFAGVFPVWDLVFGTYHLPDCPPVRCGIDEPSAGGFIDWLRYPIKSRGSAAATRASCQRSVNPG